MASSKCVERNNVTGDAWPLGGSHATPAFNILREEIMRKHFQKKKNSNKDFKIKRKEFYERHKAKRANFES